jgi:hypothetical protein
MLRPHIHPPIGHRQLDPAHLPRGDQTQQVPVQLGVTHPGIMPLTPRSRLGNPQRSRKRHFLDRVVNLCEPWPVNDLVPDRLDELLTRSAMAKQSGVASTTLANWVARDQAPLATVQAPSGDAMYTWRHLLGFCRANPKLHATRHVLEQYRERFAADPLSRPPQPSTTVRAAAAARSRPAPVGPSADVRIAGTVISNRGEPTFRQDHPKTDRSNRIVALPTFTAEALSATPRGHGRSVTGGPDLRQP